jgi:hypothetical protein
MSLRAHILSFIGSFFKFLFGNRKKKSFRKIHLEKAFGDNILSDYSPENATLGLIIVVIVLVVISWLRC